MRDYTVTAFEVFSVQMAKPKEKLEGGHARVS
jgi:hypothetical protein